MKKTFTSTEIVRILLDSMGITADQDRVINVDWQIERKGKDNTITLEVEEARMENSKSFSSEELIQELVDRGYTKIEVLQEERNRGEELMRKIKTDLDDQADRLLNSLD